MTKFMRHYHVITALRAIWSARVFAVPLQDNPGRLTTTPSKTAFSSMTRFSAASNLNISEPLLLLGVTYERVPSSARNIGI
jgi:hypothetical protein